MPDFLALVLFAILTPYLAYDAAKTVRRGHFVWRARYGTKDFRYNRRDNPVEFWLYLACEGIFCVMLCVAVVKIVLSWIRL